MKLLVAFAILLTVASAFKLRGADVIRQRELFKPVLSVLPVEEKRPDDFISNGQTASNDQFPYQVALRIQSSAGTALCGGSLISNEWVLTAAHCTVGASTVIVQLGSIQISRPAVTRTITSRSDIINHPNYDDVNIVNDISLIKIASVTFSRSIQPVTLPSIASSYPTYSGQTAIASGWGRLSDTAGSSPTLRYTQLTVISNEVCSRTFNIYSGNLCVSTPNGSSTCQGDSGGPLVLTSSGALIGLTSFGARDGCELGHPAVFTRVTSFLSWINGITGVLN